MVQRIPFQLVSYIYVSNALVLGYVIFQAQTKSVVLLNHMWFMVASNVNFLLL